MPETRTPVLEALAALDTSSWLMALSAARGVLNTMGRTVHPDPTTDGAAVAAIDAEIDRLERTQGREGSV